MTSIAEMIGPDSVNELTNTKFESPENINPKRDRYKPWREIIESDKELGEKIKSVFGSSTLIPAIHITSRAFRTDEGEVESGFIDNILKNGFRARDTNIGVFMGRDGIRKPAIPLDFVNKPEKFLRELETLIRHYYHHGTRTNKELLGDRRDVGEGLPVMLLLDVTDVPLEQGSDYEDHYKLGTSVPRSKIVGEVNLESIGAEIREKLPEIATNFLNLTQDYVNKS